MLRSMKSLAGFEIYAHDGLAGEVVDAYFDSVAWTIRYFVVSPADFPTAKKVLVAPVAIEYLDWSNRVFRVRCTKNEIRKAQPLRLDTFTTRREEDAIYRHFEHAPAVWHGVYLPDSFGITAQDTDEQAEESSGRKTFIHTFNEILGFRIKALDGGVGTVDDFLFEDGSWDQPVLVGLFKMHRETKRVAIPTKLLQPVLWAEQRVVVRAAKSIVENAPSIGDEEMFRSTFIASTEAYYDAALRAV